jgi:peptidoglycan/LPS O-acetylase OafA/YrhL
VFRGDRWLVVRKKRLRARPLACHRGGVGERGRVPALDGLRAVAVTLVVLAHLHLTPWVGGAVGVAVFFRLSGWLITGLLLSEMDRTGRIGLRRFWTRRARRLMPALVVMVAVTIGICYLLGNPQPWRLTLLPLTYTQNLAEMYGVSYGMFPHAWTLALEEQFYLLWPLVLIGARTRRRVFVVAALTVVVSLAIRQATIGDPQMAYVSPLSSCYALAAGCTLAARPWRVRPWHGVAALVGIIGCASIPGDGTANFYVQTVAVGLTCVVLAAPPVRLGAAPLVWIGRRSYGIYLWQTPILGLLGGWALGPPWAVALALTLAAAAASYRWVEQPFLRRGQPPVTDPDQGIPAARLMKS